MAVLLKYEDFKQEVAEVIEYTQVIEEDLRWVYAYLHKGKTEKNYGKASKKSLSRLVRDCEALDFAHENHQLNLDDYAMLTGMEEARNYICNKMFSTFIRNQDFTKSLEYREACTKVRFYKENFFNLIEKVKKFREFVQKRISEIDEKANC